MSDKPELVLIDITPETIEAVITKFESDNPGKRAKDMSAKEFSERMMEKIRSAAIVITGGNA